MNWVRDETAPKKQSNTGDVLSRYAKTNICLSKNKCNELRHENAD